MTLKLRVAAVIVFLSLLAIGVGLLGLFGMSQSNHGLKTVYEDRTVTLAQISQIDNLLLHNRLALGDMLAEPDGIKIKESTERIEANAKVIDGVWTQYMATYLTPEEKLLADKFAVDLKAMRTDGLFPIVSELRKGMIADARELLPKFNNRLPPVVEGINALRALQVRVAHDEYTLATKRFASLRATMIGVILLGALAAATAGYLLVRNIYRQLGGEPSYAAEIVHRIAGGDLSVQIDTAPNDRKSLLFAMQTMQQSLAETVGQLRHAAETIAAASSQIAAGNLDLSNRTEEQACSLEETAASMDQLISTVHANDGNSQQANALAQSASDVASQGGAVVAQVVETMGSINESSRRIADIVGVIDSIAFQTNILALNAAVEAARAGEQGRGFAVVASEVRSLAQRSHSAAHEIKGLIEDSVARVDQGAVLVDKAGQTMRDIVRSVADVTSIMANIGAAAHTQASGIEQINQVIRQLDEVTQQNASQVEEAAVAAESLHAQADALVRLASVFRLSEADAPQRPATVSVLRGAEVTRLLVAPQRKSRVA